MKSTRGEATLLIIGIVAAGAALGFWGMPRLFHGASKRAAASTVATANLIASNGALGASAAASVAKLGEANSMAPESPAKDFIAREVPVALSKLPAPDPYELLAAEKRRVAVMEGKFELAKSLYVDAASKADKLQKDLDKSEAARREADLDLEKAAAVELASFRRNIILGALLGLALILWLVARFYGVSPAVLGRIAADVRAGIPPIQALDANTPPRIHKAVAKAAKLATELK